MPEESIAEQIEVLAVLITVLAGLFTFAKHPLGQRFFRVIPMLVFAYFLPTVLSNFGVIPTKCPLYDFIKEWLLPASLLLLTMSVDIPAILRLGWKMLAFFLAGTATVVVGGPLAYLALGWLVQPEMGEDAWKGLAALSGSWIGGGANFIAVKESVGASESIIQMMVVVDVAVANVWMAVLLFFATREREMDEKIGADRRGLEQLQTQSEAFQKKVARVPALDDLFKILCLAIVATVVAAEIATRISPWFARQFPSAGDILGKFAWKVLVITALGVAISYSPLRKLEGAGASKFGSVLLYLLVASIGAKADFAKVAEVPSMLLIGAVWISIHAVVLLILWRLLRAPIFCVAVGSQANIGGAASAPVVAGAFHPSLAPVGALMGVLGYVLGTAAGLVCAFLLRWVHGLL